MAPVARAAIITIALAALLTAAYAGEGEASHAIFVVNSAANDIGDNNPGDGICNAGGFGVCTLRAAIQEANAHPGADTVHFTVGLIAVGNQGNESLPAITETITIDGNTGGLTRVELDGAQTNSELGERGIGLRIGAPNSIVSGLVVNRFGGAGVVFEIGSDGSTLRNSFIGTDFAGTGDQGNGYCGNSCPQYRAGVVIYGDGITIGGTSASARNVISGNNVGVRLTHHSRDTTITGNYIGTDASGSAGLGNDSYGIRVQGAYATVIGGASAGVRNVISGNGNSGIYLDQDDDNLGFEPDNTMISGNLVGTSATGSSAIGNGANGVDLGRSFNSCVGGIIVSSVCTPTSGAGNVISGNVGTGIKVPFFAVPGFGHVIIGNYIGVNAAGTTALANSGNGIDTTGYGTTIGGTSALARNVISGNGLNGVRMDRSTGVPASIQGNYIGLNAAGTQAIGNLQDGIHAERLPNCIGGDWNGSVCNPVAGGGNVISGNGSDGIEIVAGAGGNVVMGNLIGINASQTVGLGNAGHGVYINGSPGNVIGGSTGGNTIFANGLDGVRVSGAAATGNSIRGNSIHSNGGKGIENIAGGNGEPGHAPPVVTVGGFSGASGTSCGGCSIDIFSDNTQDEGRVYHGTALADGAGNWSLSGTITGPKLTATATNAAGSTTEFASFAGNPQVGPQFTVNSTGPENDGMCADQFGDCTIREAISAAIAGGPFGEVQLGNAQTYTLTGVDNPGNGLPVISKEIAIFGNGSTIARDPGAPLFRILQVPAGGTLLLDNVTVSGGEATGATGDGGGIYVNGGQLHVFNSRVSSNRAAMGTTGQNGGPGRHGGGIAISSSGSALVMQSTINGNIAGTGGLGTELNGGSGGNGGGIAVLGGTLTMERSLVNVNFAGTGRFTSANGSGGAGGHGGGLYLASGSSATVSNTTIYGNGAGGGAVGTTGNGNGGSGGGIASPSSITTLTNLTLSSNNVGTAGGPNAANGTGSGISGDFAAITVRNTIMANGTGGNCSAAAQLGSGGNISTDSSCGTTYFTQRTLAQINFGTFGNNGGPTWTLPVVPTSVAIDTGNTSYCENPPVNNGDQRGLQRPFDGDGNGTAVCDIGAFEYCPDTDSDARCNNQDNCPTTANHDQADFDADGAGDACDPEDDGDGFSDEAEAGAPLCANALDDDADGTANDGCPGGPLQVGPFSEAQFHIGTGPFDPCGDTGWPADLFGGALSTNKLTIQDISSFVAPVRRLDQSPGDANFSSRWDLLPGRGILAKFINIQDITALVPSNLGSTARPPMFSGAPAFGQTCPWAP